MSCRPLRRRVLAFAGLLAGIVVAPVPVAPPSVAAVEDASAYVAVSPARLADTRPSEGARGFTRVAPTTIRVQVTGRAGVPADATAVVLNITGIGARSSGFVTAYPAGSPLPTASTLNVDRAGRVIANLATVKVGVGGAVDIYSNIAMDLAVDVAGAYVPVDGGAAAGRLITVAGGATRVLDTRETRSPVAPGATATVPLTSLGIPADASAVVVSLVATEAAPGFWTAFPAGQARPNASNLNIDEPRQTRSAQAIVSLAGNATSFQVFSQNGGHLVVDVAGWFTGARAAVDTAGLFVPASPRRVLDTRQTGAIAPWGGSTIEFESGAATPAGTAAAALNITAVSPWNVGFLTAYPAGAARPFVSNLNVTAFDQIIANHAIVRTGQRGIALFTQSGTHMVADVTGWYLGTPEQSTLPVPAVPSRQPTNAVAVLAPKAGIATYVGYDGHIDDIVDRGLAGLWWGTGRIGTAEHNVLFAHRTSAGGPFRHLDRLRAGDTFTLLGADGRPYRYLVMENVIINPTAAELLPVVQRAGWATATIVACHPPGSVRYRMAITGRLIGLG